MEERTLAWPAPSSREVALFTDMSLYADALDLALRNGAINGPALQRELGQRLQKMRLVLQQSGRTVERLLRELRAFGWLEARSTPKLNITAAAHTITPAGEKALALSGQDARAFRRLLVVKMQEIYVVPGWFIARMWQLNPSGQGELILPAPQSEWRPKSRNWYDHAWDQVVDTETVSAARRAVEANPSAFPISVEDWRVGVQSAWERLSTLKPRHPGTKGPVSYSPRERLTLAMREAAVKLLFGSVSYLGHQADFPGERPPIYVRTFMGWCPRLEALELIFYTDWHPWVSGRLLFPTSVFRSSGSSDRFEKIDVQHPNGKSLHLYQPSWDNVRQTFIATLTSVHGHLARHTGTLYVSLLDVRDEVCRQLRISSHSFDVFLDKTIQELPMPEFPLSIAVETDIRADQTSGAGQLRRPVYLDSVPHSLVALAQLPLSGAERIRQ